MTHHFVFPRVEEITAGRPRPPVPPPRRRSQRELVLASLLQRPGAPAERER